MNSVLVGRIARVAAIGIAVLAVIDPSLTSSRASRPEVSVIAVDPSDSALAREVASRLSRTSNVLPLSFGGAAATVVVGNRIPDDAAGMGAPIFGVIPDDAASRVQLVRIDAPVRAAVDANVAVRASLDVRGAAGKTVELSLLADGQTVDRATFAVSRDTGVIDQVLSFVPTAVGATTLRVVANIAGAPARVSGDAVVDVQQRKWAVLFFDPRPSWMSTFVRRAVERDTRFAVTSRVVTSLNISTDAGRPPAALYDAAVMEVYDAIVVGAPESLNDRDVQGLERFLRRRGGSVVLLFDGNRRGPYERLASIGAFSNTSNSAGTIIAGEGTDSIALRATEWMWPQQLPAGAQVFVTSDAHAENSTGRHPLVWSVPVGAGRVIVSGALDSWKFRDPSQSSFEKFWQQAIAAAADISAGAIDVRVPNSPVRPGATVAVRISSRAAALTEVASNSAVRSTVSASLETPSGRQLVRVWPAASPGEFVGEFAAPSEAGSYRLSVSADGASLGVPVVVITDAASARPTDRSLFAAWISGSGGEVFPEGKLSDVTQAVSAKVATVERRAVWHPMRSAWWVLPFAGALALEWWLRRKRGLA